MLKICVNTRRCYDRETKEALDFNTHSLFNRLFSSPQIPLPSYPDIFLRITFFLRKGGEFLKIRILEANIYKKKRHFYSCDFSQRGVQKKIGKKKRAIIAPECRPNVALYIFEVRSACFCNRFSIM